MRVVLEDEYRGYKVVVGEVPHTAYAGRAAFRQWSYRVIIDTEDVTSKVVELGLNPVQLLEVARKHVDTRSALSKTTS